MEPAFPRDITECVEEHGLSHTANAGNAKQSIGGARTILQRFDEIVEDPVSTDKLRRIHSGRRLERINARHRASPSKI